MEQTQRSAFCHDIYLVILFLFSQVLLLNVSIHAVLMFRTGETRTTAHKTYDCFRKQIFACKGRVFRRAQCKFNHVRTTSFY